MSVKYILSQVGDKTGLNPALASERGVMLRWLNEAAPELYDQSDMPGSMFEQCFLINGNQTISLPDYVGSPRAMREYNSMMPWHVNQLRPRYNQFNWKDAWRNFRLKNKQALQATVTNQSVVVITVPFVENPPIVVSISGPTPNATSVSEDITMTATSMSTVNDFLDITSAKKNTVNTCDVTVSDVDGKLLTTIPNNRLAAMYQIVDVSTFPWLQNVTSLQDNYMEVLYKWRLPVFLNDDDEFLTGEYDNILVNKCLQLWNEEQGKPDIALAYDSKATRTLARKTEDQNRETEDEVALVANPHDTLHRRVGPGLRRRWGSYSGWGR
jgi:hypothetical protein